MPESPAGRTVYHANTRGQPCRPDDAAWMTWEGADRWYRVERPAADDPGPDLPPAETLFDTEPTE